MRWQDAWMEEVNYMNDPRVNAQDSWKGYDKSKKVITRKIYLEIDPGDKRFPQLVHIQGDWENSTMIFLEDFPVDFPSKFEVCSLCDGEGRHVNPSIDASGISGEDFHEDPDFAEDYFSGVYDQQCNQCRGNRVVPVVDESSHMMKQEIEVPITTYNGDETGETVKITLAELWKHELEMEEDRWRCHQESLAERRMGA